MALKTLKTLTSSLSIISFFLLLEKLGNQLFVPQGLEQAGTLLKMDYLFLFLPNNLFLTSSPNLALASPANIVCHLSNQFQIRETTEINLHERRQYMLMTCAGVGQTVVKGRPAM